MNLFDFRSIYIEEDTKLEMQSDRLQTKNMSEREKKNREKKLKEAEEIRKKIRELRQHETQVEDVNIVKEPDKSKQKPDRKKPQLRIKKIKSQRKKNRKSKLKSTTERKITSYFPYLNTLPRRKLKLYELKNPTQPIVVNDPDPVDPQSGEFDIKLDIQLHNLFNTKEEPINARIQAKSNDARVKIETEEENVEIKNSNKTEVHFKFPNW